MMVDDQYDHYPVHETAILEKLRAHLMQYLSHEFLIDDIDFSEHALFMSDQIAMRLRAHVWAETESQQVQRVKYPATWWDAVKERFYPSWMLARWPVQYTEIEYSVRVLYPELRLALPDHTHVYEVVRRDGPFHD